jgi:hypothetical protein
VCGACVVVCVCVVCGVCVCGVCVCVCVCEVQILFNIISTRADILTPIQTKDTPEQFPVSHGNLQLEGQEMVHFNIHPQ